MAAPPGVLAHLALTVRDVQLSERWYGGMADFVRLGAGELALPAGYAGEGTRLVLREGTPSEEEMRAVGELLTVAFTVRDIQETAAKARSLGARIVKGPDHRHLWLQDPTGYVVHFVGPAQPATPLTPGWRYVGLRVDDLPAAQDYYVSRFGFEVLPEKTGDDGTAMARVAPADKRYARFSLQYYPSRPARPSVPGDLFAVGIRAVDLETRTANDPAGYALELTST